MPPVMVAVGPVGVNAPEVHASWACASTTLVVPGSAELALVSTASTLPALHVVSAAICPGAPAKNDAMGTTQAPDVAGVMAGKVKALVPALALGNVTSLGVVVSIPR